MTKISIIMPVFNSEKYLKNAINSVLNQTISDIELICIDDGSTDNSLNILKKFSSKYDFIRVLSQENQGSGSARNKGLDIAKGDFIAFLDSDDFYLENNALEIMYDQAKLHNVDMVSANICSLTPKRHIFNKEYNCHRVLCFNDYGEHSPKDYGIPWSFYKNIFRREIIDKYYIRFPDFLRGQDPVFLAQFLSKIDKFCGVPILYYAYMISPPGTNLLNTSIKKSHYLTHYKEVFEILDENNFVESSKKYKKTLIDLLRNFNSLKDLDAYELYLEVFKDCSYFLEDYQADLDFLHFSYIFNKMLIVDSQEYYDFVKNEIKDYKFWQNQKITKALLQKINLVKHYDSYSEFKAEYLELDYKLNLIQIRNLKKINKNLNEELKPIRSENKRLLNSNSIRLVKKIKNLVNSK